MLRNVKLMINMKQSKEYSKQFATFNSHIFLFKVFRDLRDSIFPLYTLPLNNLVKYSNFCINLIPYNVLSSGIVLTFLFIIKKNLTPNTFIQHVWNFCHLLLSLFIQTIMSLFILWNTHCIYFVWKILFDKFFWHKIMTLPVLTTVHKLPRN